MKTARRLFVIFYRVAAAVIVAAAALIVLLMVFGIFPYAVQTGSMEPTIRAGSLCFVNRRVSVAELEAGDIVTYKQGDMRVTHRAVRFDAGGVITRGDANNSEDATRVTDENLVGRAVFWIPWVGEAFLLLKTLRGKLAAAALLLLFLAAGLYYDRLTGRSKESQESEVRN